MNNMITLYIRHPEQTLIFQNIQEHGYYYAPQLETVDRYAEKHGGAYCLVSIDKLPVWDLRRELYSRFLNPSSFVSKKEKEEIKTKVEKNKDLQTRLDSYTDELCEKIYNEQNIDDLSNIRSLEEIKKSFQLPRLKLSEQIKKNQDDIDNMLTSINQRFISKLDLNVQKHINESFNAISYLRLPPYQIDRLISIWTKMDKVIKEYMNSNLFGDELDFYNII